MRSSLLTSVGIAAIAAAAHSAPPEPSVEILLQTDHTILGEPFAYPAGRANVTAARVTVPPGGLLELHLHPVPVLAYILQGELVVDYGSEGTRTYRKGDTFVEAFEWPHRGRNGGRGNVEILAFYVGAEGVANTVPLE